MHCFRILNFRIISGVSQETLPAATYPFALKQNEADIDSRPIDQFQEITTIHHIAMSLMVPCSTRCGFNNSAW